jgi:hypothetical protein
VPFLCPPQADEDYLFVFGIPFSLKYT